MKIAQNMYTQVSSTLKGKSSVEKLVVKEEAKPLFQFISNEERASAALDKFLYNEEKENINLTSDEVTWGPKIQFPSENIGEKRRKLLDSWEGRPY